MSKNFIEDIIYNIRRELIYSSLMRWKKKMTLSEVTMRNVKPELREEASKLYIHRSVQGGDIFVDIYWYIKRSKNTPHEDYIYYRCNWTKAKQVIAKVEKTELPERAVSLCSKLRS